MGDRALDLGRLLASQVFKLKDHEGYLLRFTLTKTLRKEPPPPLFFRFNSLWQIGRMPS